MKRHILIATIALAVLGTVFLFVPTARADSIEAGSGGCWCGGDSPPATWGWGERRYADGSYHWAYCYQPTGSGYC